MTDTISAWRQETIDRDARTDAMGAAIAALLGGTYSRGEDHTAGGIEFSDDLFVMLRPETYGAKKDSWKIDCYLAGAYRAAMHTTKTLFTAGAGKEATAERIAKRIKTELAKPETVALIAQCAETAEAKRQARAALAADIDALQARFPSIRINWNGKEREAKISGYSPTHGSFDGAIYEGGGISFQYVRPVGRDAAEAIIAAIIAA